MAGKWGRSWGEFPEFSVKGFGTFLVNGFHFGQERGSEGVVLGGFVFGIGEGGARASWGMFGVRGHRRGGEGFGKG